METGKSRLEALLAAIFVLWAAPAFAQTPTLEDRIEWSLAAGYGFSVHLNLGRSDERLVLIEPAFGYMLSKRVEYIVEAHAAVYFSPGGYMLGWMPLGAVLLRQRRFETLRLDRRRFRIDRSHPAHRDRPTFQFSAPGEPRGSRENHGEAELERRSASTTFERSNCAAESRPQLRGAPRRLAVSLVESEREKRSHRSFRLD